MIPFLFMNHLNETPVLLEESSWREIVLNYLMVRAIIALRYERSLVWLKKIPEIRPRPMID